MEPIAINKSAWIIDGLLAGMSGRVVGADSRHNEVTIEIESGTLVSLDRERVGQTDDTGGERRKRKCQTLKVGTPNKRY